MYQLDSFSSLSDCSLINNDVPSGQHVPVDNDPRTVEWPGFDNVMGSGTLLELPCLAPGFRFYPTDEELVTFYLANKIRNPKYQNPAIIEADLRNCEPWELPEKASSVGEKEWYFYAVRDRKYPSGTRANRATKAGYWKATGKDREILLKKKRTKDYIVEDVQNQNTLLLIGWKKTLVFYEGRAPKGQKTNWVMHEYRSSGAQHSRNPEAAGSGSEWVVCRVFNKGRRTTSYAAAGAGDQAIISAAAAADGDSCQVGGEGASTRPWKLDVDPVKLLMSTSTAAPAGSGAEDLVLDLLDWPNIHHHRHRDHIDHHQYSSCCSCPAPPALLPHAPGSRELHLPPSSPGYDDTPRRLLSCCSFNPSYLHDILPDTF